MTDDIETRRAERQARAAVLHLEARRGTPWPGWRREPTPADLVEWLRARPEIAADVVAALRPGDDTGFDAAPARYVATGREAIDVIRDELGDAACWAFCLGNARKYELRAGHKGDAATDLEKARWYRAFAAFVEGVGEDPRTYRREVPDAAR